MNLGPVIDDIIKNQKEKMGSSEVARSELRTTHLLHKHANIGVIFCMFMFLKQPLINL